MGVIKMSRKDQNHSVDNEKLSEFSDFPPTPQSPFRCAEGPESLDITRALRQGRRATGSNQVGRTVLRDARGTNGWMSGPVSLCSRDERLDERSRLAPLAG